MDFMSHSVAYRNKEGQRKEIIGRDGRGKHRDPKINFLAISRLAESLLTDTGAHRQTPCFS